MFLMEQPQRVQNATASFVMNKFCRLPEVLQLKWLPVPEVPSDENTRFDARRQSRNTIENTFGACAPKILNELPQDVRKCGEYKVFLKKTKTFLFEKVMAKSFS